MSLLWMDSFDRAATAGDITWYEAKTGTPTVSSGGRTGNQAILNGTYIEKQFGSNYSTLIVGVANRFTTATQSASDTILFYDGTTLQFKLRREAAVASSAVWTIYNGDGTLLATTTEPTVEDTWAYLEIKVTFHGTTGSYEFRINGVLAASGTNVDTINSANAYANRVRLQGVGATWFDDLYICDDAGGSFDDYLGAVQIEWLDPNANGTYSQWTGSDADATDNYLLVDEAQHNSDTDYLYESNVGDIDSFGFENLSGAVTVLAVKHLMVARKDDATTRKIQAFRRIGGADDVATEVTLTTSYAWYETTWTDLDNSEVDAGEFGVKVHT